MKYTILRTLRERSGRSLTYCAVHSETSVGTVRMFEVEPSNIHPSKRLSLERVYTGIARELGLPPSNFGLGPKP